MRVDMVVRGLFGLILIAYSYCQAATIKCVITNDQRWVNYEGGVDLPDPALLRQEFSRCFDNVRGAVPVIRLNSGGGYVTAGLEMAHFIATTGERRGVRMEVAPGARCVSACTFLFIAGSDRFVPAGSKLEPHGFSSLNGSNPELVKGKNWADPDPERRPHVNTHRLKWAAHAIGLHLYAEDRDVDGLKRVLACKGPAQCQAAFLALDDTTRELLTAWDGAIRRRYIDLERSAALAAMYQHGNFGEPHVEKINEGIALVSTKVFAATLDQNLGAKRSKRVDPATSSASALIVEQLQDHLKGTTETASDLWRLIQRKSGELDAKALVDLMFSTSILYTRPLTREEMCDASIVNVDC